MLDVFGEKDDITTMRGTNPRKTGANNMIKTIGQIRIERMSNGLIRAFDYASGLWGLYELDGTPRSGDLARALPNLIKTR